MEPHQDTTSHHENAVDVEGDERLRSSSASSTSSTNSSEFQDPIQVNSFKKDKLSRRNSSEDQNKIERGTREPDGGDESSLQSPPIQKMERPDNGSGYRIPSYVFARNKSGTPVEWSTTSNDSLFSIHTGTASFAGDKYSWLLEAADLYGNNPKSEESPPAPEILAPENEISSVQSPSSPVDSATVVVADHGVNEVVVITRPEEGEEKINTSVSMKAKPSMGEDHISSRSNESGQSFAFPMLENQLEKGGGSMKSVKSGLSSVPEKPEQQKESPTSEPNEEQTPSPEAANPAACSWFGSCMACFTCKSAKMEKDDTASKG